MSSSQNKSDEVASSQKWVIGPKYTQCSETYEKTAFPNSGYADPPPPLKNGQGVQTFFAYVSEHLETTFFFKC